MPADVELGRRADALRQAHGHFIASHHGCDESCAADLARSQIHAGKAGWNDAGARVHVDAEVVQFEGLRQRAVRKRRSAGACAFAAADQAAIALAHARDKVGNLARRLDGTAERDAAKVVEQALRRVGFYVGRDAPRVGPQRANHLCELFGNAVCFSLVHVVFVLLLI